jgi:hypothetical protein
MRLLSTISLAMGMIFECAAGPIDFTPTTEQRQLEGITFPEVIFHQDGHAISYEPPRGWTFVGNEARLTLAPPNTSQAQASLEQAALPSPQIFDEQTVEQLRSLVLGSLPPDAQNVQLVAAESNPVRINQQDSYEITASYTYLGQAYQVSVIFANLGDLQVRCRIVTRKENFEELRRAFRGSLFTLHWS